jgi:VIT1/CCC1 family predicted Fe2+/Mn2+ transporter
MADGLTVPFALAAGLSGVVDSNKVIVIAGLAEIAAGTIAMGLGGYLAAKTQREHYEAELKREAREIQEVPHIEKQEVANIFATYGVPDDQLPLVVDSIASDPIKWRDFMMKFELNLDKPKERRELYSPLVIGSAYALGGLIPLSPYIFTVNTYDALNYSLFITIITLFAFGIFKGSVTGTSKFKSGVQTSIIGSLAAFAAFSIAKLFS